MAAHTHTHLHFCFPKAHLRRHSLIHKRIENYNPKLRKLRNVIIEGQSEEVPLTEVLLPEAPLPEVLLPEAPQTEVLLPEAPLLEEAPVPKAPLPEEAPLPEDAPLPEVLLPEEALLPEGALGPIQEEPSNVLTGPTSTAWTQTCPW